VKKSLSDPDLSGELDFLASKSLICRQLQLGGEFFLLLFLAERKSKEKCWGKESGKFFTFLIFPFRLSIMQNQFITTSSIQTKKLGEMLARELSGGEIICLSGELGAGKTTFTQGLLKGLKIKGPYTSPTFAIMKLYEAKNCKAYHLDAYRVGSKDILDIGWKDFAGKKDSIVIIEWAEKVKKIIPTKAFWINFKWMNEKERKITLKNI
jgi:tRNA threonylcarbamoyladenosine biosynthesis protein TsaE